MVRRARCSRARLSCFRGALQGELQLGSGLFSQAQQRNHRFGLKQQVLPAVGICQALVYGRLDCSRDVLAVHEVIDKGSRRELGFAPRRRVFWILADGCGIDDQRGLRGCFGNVREIHGPAPDSHAIGQGQ